MTDIGKLRRSTLISTFGPGSIVDFRARGGATISGIVAGLEEWDSNFPPPGVTNPQSTTEPRLIQKLRQKGFQVDGFRLPPALTDRDIAESRERLVAAEFPRWHLCPACDRIGPARLWGQRPATAAHYCPACGTDARDVYVVPVRFVLACDHGHIDDFPWHFWVGHARDCSNRAGFLLLKVIGAGLGGLQLSCPECRAERRLEGAFSEQTWRGFSCSGARPWLAGADQTGCQRPVRAVQRGATNLYFPVTESSLDIPPWSDSLQQQLGQYWAPIMEIQDAGQRAIFVRVLAQSSLKPVIDALRMTAEDLIEEITRRVELLNRSIQEDLRAEEYRQFAYGSDTRRDEGGQFEIRVEPVPAEIENWISRAVRVVRLREVRALTGFTRILPYDGGNADVIAAISAAPTGWLPAIEVFGEGIYVDFHRDTLRGWEERGPVRLRAAEITRRWKAEYRSRYGSDPLWSPSPRFLLVHTFAHALMRQLTLDCGYSSAALRERLYASDGDSDMAGLLVYTATTDADGTLGGLQRQGTSDRLRRVIPAAIQALEWCSSDPLCIENLMTPLDAASGAACHACVLSPETACEHFNRFLDRALLVGTPDDPQIGYFSGLLRVT